MIIKHIVVGWLRTNCYLLGDEETRTCALIDPGQKADTILEAVAELGYELKMILLTHGHYDHVMAVPKIVEKTGAKVYIHKKDQWLLSCDEVLRYGTRAEGYSVPHVDGWLEEGMTLSLGSLTIRVLHTPGHTRGSVCYYDAENGILFSGDTLFCAGFGRMDLYGGSPAQMRTSLRSLFELPGDTQVYCGHGPMTSIRSEKRRYSL